MTELTSLTISQALELTRAHLEQIEAQDPVIGAYLTVTAEQALQQAQAADQALAERARHAA